MTLRLILSSALLALLVSGTAHAEKADRDKPVNLEADRVTVDDVKKQQVFEGNVQLVKGTLIIRAERLVVTQDDGGYQRGVATGTAAALPHFRQKREGVDEYVDGEAERIEHDARNERTEFFGRARVKSGLDEVRGQYIAYDAKSENYVVTSGPNGSRAKPGSGERVRAVIQPREKTTDAKPAPAATGATPPLKGAATLNTQGQENPQ